MSDALVDTSGVQQLLGRHHNSNRIAYRFIIVPYGR
jgi:hypothetical protein